LLFATVSGAHLYGFPSADSDFDLRGVHILPLAELVGPEPGEQTTEVSGTRGGHEIDLVTHEARKFFELLLKPNGYVLEQLYSPLIVQTSDAQKQRRVKPLLYLYRVLLTGIHLMRTGVVEANLVTLNEHYRLPQISELVERKVHGHEQIRLDDGDADFHEREFARLTGELERARQESSLPEAPSARPALNDLLLRLRLEPEPYLYTAMIPI
jgi:predicted nucleotidyltransferase